MDKCGFTFHKDHKDFYIYIYIYIYIYKPFIDIWFVSIDIKQFLAEIQLFENLESGGANKSKY